MDTACCLHTVIRLQWQPSEWSSAANHYTKTNTTTSISNRSIRRPAPLEMCIVGVWQGECKKGEQESTRTRQRNDRSPDVVRPTQGYQQQLYYGQSFCRYIADSDYVPRNESIVTNQDSRPRLFSGSSSIPSRVFIHLYAVTVLTTDLHRSHLTISFLAWFDNVHTIYIGAPRDGKVSLSTL